MTDDDGHWRTKTTTDTITQELFTTTKTVDGHKHRFTETSTLTTVQATPVTVTTIDTYYTFDHGRWETRT